MSAAFSTVRLARDTVSVRALMAILLDGGYPAFMCRTIPDNASLYTAKVNERRGFACAQVCAGVAANWSVIA
ncbi:hypothetical protein MPSYJ_10670 [Mycolicibacterium psychrotolerans]|uniref:Uncharacterized protein n=1 Tax=Mycolicibacterium psychrotolerans TaxID=216929 RepID=A0A7I7M6K6_9MYCO|nr:hypothetical protein MPSYJ_10670 [Mycolicibacterium psychrotolerans]